MNAKDATEMLGRIFETWPNGKWPAGTVAEWKSDLARLDFDVAEQTRATLKESWEQTIPPAFGLFVSTYQAHARRIAIEREAARPVEEWGGPTDAGRAEIAAIRARHGWTQPESSAQ
jgi:hypothetical protein